MVKGKERDCDKYDEVPFRDVYRFSHLVKFLNQLFMRLNIIEII